MTEIDAALVRRKLAAIIRNLADLAVIDGLDLEEYRRDRFRLKETERDPGSLRRAAEQDRP